MSANLSFLGMLRVIPNLWAFMRYIRKLVRERRAAPRDDLLSALVHAEEAGEQLTFESPQPRWRDAEVAADVARSKFGAAAVRPASLLTPRQPQEPAIGTGER